MSSSSSAALQQQELGFLQEQLIRSIPIHMLGAAGAQLFPYGERATLIIPYLTESNKDGVSPASKAAIAAMPVVKISGVEEELGECTICLTEYCNGEEVKEMPCKHRYHSGCIDKWLGLHGSCPVCRHEIPVDEEMVRGGGVPGAFVIEFVHSPDADHLWRIESITRV